MLLEEGGAALLLGALFAGAEDDESDAADLLPPESLPLSDLLSEALSDLPSDLLSEPFGDAGFAPDFA